MGLLQKLKDALDAPTYEPQKRFVGGAYGWANHRFPIKGGINFREVMIRNMYEPNNHGLLKQLMDKKND